MPDIKPTPPEDHPAAIVTAEGRVSDGGRVADRDEFHAALERVKKDHAKTFEMLADL